MVNYPPLSFDASYKSLPDKIFSFKANAFDIYEDSLWPCTGVKIGAGNKVPDNLLWVINKSNVYAPVDGVTNIIYFSEGQYLPENRLGLFTLYTDNKFLEHQEQYKHGT